MKSRRSLRCGMDRDEAAVICEHGHQHLLGYMGPAEEAEPEAGPAGYAGMQPLEDVCVEGLCCSAGICAERDAKVSDRRASCTEGDACGLVWANKVLERANAHADGLGCAAAWLPSHATCRADAARPERPAASAWSAGVHWWCHLHGRCRNGEAWPIWRA